MIAINRISLSWRFVIIDLLLFTVFYFINNHLNIAGDLLMYIFTMALRIFFLMLVLETGHVFAVSLKQWIPVFVSYCILFFAGYIIVIFFSQQVMAPCTFFRALSNVLFNFNYVHFAYPFLIASVYYIWQLKN